MSIKHATFMVDFFNSHGIPSIALSSESSKEKRNNAKKLLQSKSINFIFVVDLYNEGVDIPDINMVLFLRPTNSLRIYIQQFGRGLRKTEGKDILTVLDFVGHHNKKFNFAERYRALIGRSKRNIKQEIEDDFINLPKGCYIQLEKQAREYILENIKAQTLNSRNIINKIIDYKNNSHLPLTLKNFLLFYGLEAYHIYSLKTGGMIGWKLLCAKAQNVLSEFNEPDQKRLGKGLERMQWINSRRWITYLICILNNINKFNENTYKLNNEEENNIYPILKFSSKEIRKQWLLMLYYTIWTETPPIEQGFKNFSDFLNIFNQNPEIKAEYIELLEYKLEVINFIDKSVDIGFDCALDLHCNYTLKQVLAALNKIGFDMCPRFSEGCLYMEEKKLDAFFVTLEKTEKFYSPTTMYRDYSMSETLFHWQSQSKTSENSNTGKRFINEKHPILLFVRKSRTEYKSMIAPYHYLGPVKYKKHDGSKPINIIWELEHPMISSLYSESKILSND